MGLSEEATLLQTSPLFSLMTEAELEGVVEASERHAFRAGDTILREGDPQTTGCYAILSGHVEVTKDGQRLAQLSAGELFGEMSLLIEMEPQGAEASERSPALPDDARLIQENAPRSADVVAQAETTVLRIKPWTLYGLIRSRPDIALKMLATLARRLRANNASLSG